MMHVHDTCAAGATGDDDVGINAFFAKRVSLEWWPNTQAHVLIVISLGLKRTASNMQIMFVP